MKTAILILCLAPVLALADTICKSKDAKGTITYFQGPCANPKDVRIDVSRPTDEQVREGRAQSAKMAATAADIRDKEREQELINNLKHSSIGGLRANKMALDQLYREKLIEKQNGGK